eukprot:426638-Hanusia_phi.AAC.2
MPRHLRRTVSPSPLYQSASKEQLSAPDHRLRRQHHRRWRIETWCRALEETSKHQVILSGEQTNETTNTKMQAVLLAEETHTCKHISLLRLPIMTLRHTKNGIYAHDHKHYEHGV